MNNVALAIEQAKTGLILFLDERRVETTENPEELFDQFETVKMFNRTGQMTIILQDVRDGFVYLVDWLGSTGVCKITAFEKVDEGSVNLAAS